MKNWMIMLACTLAFSACCQAPAGTPSVVAHRGYWKCEGGAQNSISSLANAAAIKVWGSEFDVWMTADDTLVVNHDPKLHHVMLKDAKFADVKNLQLDNGELISTVDQYLTKGLEYPDMQMVFEIKTYKDVSDTAYEARVVPAVIGAVKKYGLENRTTFIAFSLTLCEQIAKLMPENTVQYLNGDLSPKEVFEHGINGIDYHYSCFKEHPEWVKEAHDLGMSVNCWTVNSASDIKQMIALGVDQITTNEPTLAQKLISGKSCCCKKSCCK